MDAATPGREDELRIYLVVRSDLALPRLVLAEVAARATWAAAEAGMRVADPRLRAYDNDVQAKIGLRVKSEGHLLRAAREAEAAGIPCGMVESAPGVPAAVGIGPVRRADLPRFVGGLQMLGDAAPEGPGPEAAVPADPEAEAVFLLVREDAGIPYGKLVPQAGHGLWAAVSRTFAHDAAAVERWHAAGSPVRVAEVSDLPAMEAAHRAADRAGLVSALIVDAGRTVFGRPTETVVGIGPCLPADLPPEVPRPPGEAPPRPR